MSNGKQEIMNNYSADEEILLYGAILVNTESEHDKGDILSGECNVTQSGSPDLRIVADAPNGAEQWRERKGPGSTPRFQFFYFALPVPGSKGAGVATEAVADQSISVEMPQSGPVPMAALTHEGVA